MEDNALVTAIMTRIAILAPIIIVWVAGIVIALMRWERHPRVSLFAMIALAMMIATAISTSVLYTWLPIAIRDNGWSVVRMSPIFGAIGVVAMAIEAIAWLMALWAIFGWRDPQKKETLFPTAPPAFGNEPSSPPSAIG